MPEMGTYTTRLPSGKVVTDPRIVRRRRNRIMLALGVGALLLCVGGAVGWFTLRPAPPSTFASPVAVTSDGGDRAGIAVAGEGPVLVEFYLDLACPSCRTVHDAMAATVDQLVADGRVRLVWHPIATPEPVLLPGQQAPADVRPPIPAYNTRAANAVACAADAGRLREFAGALYANLPADPTSGMNDDQLIAVAGPAGLNAPAFARCVRDLSYRDWVANVTAQAAQRGVGAAPAVFVNGAPLTDLSPQALRAAVG
jgi:protein-disulfide isomerase